MLKPDKKLSGEPTTMQSLKAVFFASCESFAVLLISDAVHSEGESWWFVCDWHGANFRFALFAGDDRAQSTAHIYPYFRKFC